MTARVDPNVEAPVTPNVPVKVPLTAVTLPLAERFPLTVNFSLGVAVPTPTLPPSLTINAVPDSASVNTATSCAPVCVTVNAV